TDATARGTLVTRVPALRLCTCDRRIADNRFNRYRATEPDEPRSQSMKRRTLDILFSVGGVGLAALLLVLGVVMTSNANFAKSYVKDQLTQQNISFKPAAALTPEEAKSSCLVQFAGQKLTTGKQAECYANDFIGLHVKSVANGQTYADLGTPQSDLTAKVKAATASNDPALPDLQKELTAITGQR